MPEGISNVLIIGIAIGVLILSLAVVIVVLIYIQRKRLSIFFLGFFLGLLLNE